MSNRVDTCGAFLLVWLLTHSAGAQDAVPAGTATNPGPTDHGVRLIKQDRSAQLEAQRVSSFWLLQPGMAPADALAVTANLSEFQRDMLSESMDDAMVLESFPTTRGVVYSIRGTEGASLLALDGHDQALELHGVYEHLGPEARGFRIAVADALELGETIAIVLVMLKDSYEPGQPARSAAVAALLDAKTGVVRAIRVLDPFTTISATHKDVLYREHSAVSHMRMIAQPCDSSVLVAIPNRGLFLLDGKTLEPRARLDRPWRFEHDTSLSYSLFVKPPWVPANPGLQADDFGMVTCMETHSHGLSMFVSVASFLEVPGQRPRVAHKLLELSRQLVPINVAPCPFMPMVIAGECADDPEAAQFLTVEGSVGALRAASPDSAALYEDFGIRERIGLVAWQTTPDPLAKADRDTVSYREWAGVAARSGPILVSWTGVSYGAEEAEYLRFPLVLSGEGGLIAGGVELECQVRGLDHNVRLNSVPTYRGTRKFGRGPVRLVGMLPTADGVEVVFVRHGEPTKVSLPRKLLVD